jgi:hypothetical protein
MPKLRPRARIIRTIGDQLISGPEAALIELVKNAYDADSPSVLIKITPALDTNDGGSILVSDEGHGMSSADILNNWFEPATDEKARRRTSPGGRVMLGAKGIGRFAASKLGRYTTLKTVCSQNAHRHLTKVEIDWEWFDSAKYLDQVEIPIQEQKLPSSSTRSTGVQLTIQQLRDEWTKRRLEILIRELRRLASPAETLQTTFRIRLDVTDFTKESRGFEGQELLSELNLSADANDSDENDAESDPFLIQPFGLQKVADYVLKGSFNTKGFFTGTFAIFKGDKVKQRLQVPPPVLSLEETSSGAFGIQINIYDRERESIEALFERMNTHFARMQTEVYDCRIEFAKR